MHLKPIGVVVGLNLDREIFFLLDENPNKLTLHLLCSK
jgi:hypothetical protein